MWYSNINWWFFAAINCAIGLVFFVAMFSPWWALLWVPAGVFAAYHAHRLSVLWEQTCPHCSGAGMLPRRTDDNLFVYYGTCVPCDGTGTKQQ